MTEQASAGTGEDISPIVFSSFNTMGLPPQEAIEVWRDSIAPLFDARPVGPGDFYGAVDACLFNGIVLAQSRAAAQVFRRDRRMRNRDGVDHFLVQFYLEGGYRGEHAGLAVRVGAGDVGVLDLGAETHTNDLEFRCLTLVVPRDTLRPFVKHLDCGGTVIAGSTALGRILNSHLTATWRNLPGLPGREAPYVAQALLGVLAACIDSQCSGTTDRTDPYLPAATAVAIRDYIEHHLERVDLDPEHLCRTFHCSRAYLYRLFASEGGVARHIQQRRLLRCYRELTRPGNHRPRVGEIAGRWGFVNASHFSRLFREVFGVAPRDALGGADQARGVTALGADPRPDLPAYHDWLLSL
ncbi:helix-turn-helix domain-containing protein [Candidatus Thiodictyon syntrophicum]|jgi:AraC-like DNA-binding protein|uniref:HTH araC/xylS-type domain-containing protein n=1 Tax=Candidatus Thiodictyon syntrophicum TaxID=1166950 RepID=A0A2K8UAZ2_9GAMM|nr:helix-turn-helix domain-containing protein [Candidatus Thiodictyon syntrophicum]AUB82748.1 hypothetical protein THSYN_18595 [Candidatus Thiodictyon syntrophicum]